MSSSKRQNTINDSASFRASILFIITACSVFILCTGCSRPTEYESFSDYPGFGEYFKDRCSEREAAPSVTEEDRRLLSKYSPRIILPPGGRYPVNFYRDYLPHTVLRRYADNEIILHKVSPDVLREYEHNKQFYLDFQYEKFRSSGLDLRVSPENGTAYPENIPAAYGRVYREYVDFPCPSRGICYRSLTFLKYNFVFPISGLPARLPAGYEFVLKLAGLDPDDWHELDNFVSIHIVLNKDERPVAVLLAQHDYHRSYVIGKDSTVPADMRLVFDIALRSNEVYPGSGGEIPVEHPAVASYRHLKYLISSEDLPLLSGQDVTFGQQAGGVETPYTLDYLSPCDPFYTASIILGEPRFFFGIYVGRSGPNGADYYTVPELMALGKLLKFSYLQEGDEGDIKMLEHTIDESSGKIDIDGIINHNGKKMYRDLTSIENRPKSIK
jgi:hypothetical protein